jgi:hypothetical protein
MPVVIYSFEESTTSLSVTDKDNVSVISQISYNTDGTTKVFKLIGPKVLGENNCIAVLDGFIYQSSGGDYTIDFKENTVVFNTPPTAGKVLVLHSFTASSGATVGAFFGGVGAAPGSALGTLLSSGSYVLSGAGEGIYNALFNKNASGRMRLVGDKTDWKGDFRDVADYYSSLSTLRDDIVTNVPLEIPGVAGGTGSDTYTLGGSGIVIQPGVASPTYQHFLQVKGALNKLNLNADMPNSYVSFDGVNKPIDDLSEETITGNASAFQAIWSDLISKSGGKFDEKLKQFIVGVTPQAGGRGDKAAVVLKLPTEYLKQWEPTADNKKITSIFLY